MIDTTLQIRGWIFEITYKWFSFLFSRLNLHFICLSQPIIDPRRTSPYLSSQRLILTKHNFRLIDPNPYRAKALPMFKFPINKRKEVKLLILKMSIIRLIPHLNLFPPLRANLIFILIYRCDPKYEIRIFYFINSPKTAPKWLAINSDIRSKGIS